MKMYPATYGGVIESFNPWHEVAQQVDFSGLRFG